MARVWHVRRSPTALPRWLAAGFYAALIVWAAVVLFPLYWIVVTSFKLPIHVYAGPVYLPFVDFTPSLHAWRYIFVDLRNDTLRPFENTVVVALVSPIYVMFPRLSLLDTRAALIITYTAVNLPIVVWLMRDYFRNISLELEESAAIDGASPYRIFWSIVLPLATPGLAATFLLVLVFSWNEYLFALFLTSANAQTLPLSIAAQNATRGPMWWYMSVLILIMITPVIAMAIALERYIAKGLLVGALKG